MKVADTHILFVPDRSTPTPGHWQWRWRQKLSTGRFVMPDAEAPQIQARAAAIVEAVNASTLPSLIVAHGDGIVAAIAAIPGYTQRVAGAFFVAPPDLNEVGEPGAEGFPSHIRSRLPFPAMLVASRNDPACSYEAAEKIAAGWGATVLDAGEAGHIDEAAGYGPWPEGTMVFAQFLRNLA